MADAQKLTDFTKKGLVYVQKGIEILKRENAYESLTRAYINLGIIQRDLDDFKGAKNSFLIGIALAEKHNIKGTSLALLYADLGQNFIDFGKDYDKAIFYLKKSINLYNQENYRKGIEHAHRNLSHAYRLKKDFPLAIFHANIAVEISKSLKDNHRLFNSYDALFQAQEAAGDYKSAFENLKLAKTYEDSTLKVEKLKSIAEVETKYQTVKKEAQISILAEKNKAQQKSLWLLMAGLIVTLGFIGAIYLQNKKLNESRKQISDQADQLKLMMKELHHRVKNNLAIVSSLLRIQSTKLEDKTAKAAIAQGQQRVDAMSLIHQRLYQTDKVTTINIKEYIIDLAESLMAAYDFEPNKFDLNISVEKEELDVDLAIPLGLIINELLTNSFKYAYSTIEKPALNISLKGNKNLDLEIKDNGIGIDLNRWKTAKDSFGKKLISGLVNQIGGKFTIENDAGTVFKMKIAA
jgi:two-component sensor histidine kinase